MRADTLTLFGVFKKMLSEEDASLVVRYMEDANERKIIKTVENKIEHLATKEDIAALRLVTKEDIANIRTELKGDISNLRTELKGDISDLRAEMKEDGTKQIKWAFIFWIGQIGVILGMLYYFLGR